MAVPSVPFLCLQILYMDTEGFEASGKADAYDDRIFALSTVIASVLVYNLPETVRESDVEKLSFAVELADAFFSDAQVLPVLHTWLPCIDTCETRRCQSGVC